MEIKLAIAKYIRQIMGMLIITTCILSGSFMYLRTRQIPEGGELATDWTEAEKLAKARLDKQKVIQQRDKKLEQEKEEAKLKAEEEARKKLEEEKLAKEKAEAEEKAKKEEEERLAKEQAEKEEQERIAQEQQAKQQQQTQTYEQPVSQWNGVALTPGAGTIMGPSGKETYYNLPMEGVVSIMRSMGNTDKYWVREDGVKMLGDYVMIAAELNSRPRGSLVQTSLGMGIVCDTGGFAASNPTQIDIATAW